MIKRKIYNWIKKTLVHPLATKCGYVPWKTDLYHRKFSQNEKNQLLNNFYSILNSIKYEPKHIMDVGANHGTWTREALLFFPNVFITMIEPQHWLQPSFQDILDQYPRVSYQPVGAGRKSGNFKFTIMERDDSCTFNISESDAQSAGYKQIDLPIITLNEIIKSQSIPFPDIIKIDAEGLDIEVLEGASDCFGKTEIFMVEAAVVSKEMPNTLLTLTQYMDKKGYSLFDITDLNRPFKLKVLWLTELVFVKKGGILDSLNQKDILH
jgi:FkbM family methyltransferase